MTSQIQCTLICKNMGFHQRKSMTKKAPLPKISMLLQFGGEVLAILCYDDSIKTLSLQFQTFGIQAK